MKTTLLITNVLDRVYVTEGEGSASSVEKHVVLSAVVSAACFANVVRTLTEPYEEEATAAIGVIKKSSNAMTSETATPEHESIPEFSRINDDPCSYGQVINWDNGIPVAVFCQQSWLPTDTVMPLTRSDCSLKPM